MRIRSLGLTLFSVMALLVAACSSGSTPSPSSGASAPATSASAAASAPATSASAPASGKQLKIGLVTDVGQLDDKSFNQFTNEGAKAAADQLGAQYNVIVTKNISDYRKNIDTFVQQGYDIIVTAGSLLGSDTAAAALANKNIHFVGIDQAICVDKTGKANFTDCSGDPATLMPNYQGVTFAEEQAGYLVGIVAASISKSGTIGAVAGTNVPAVVRYIAGYKAGAQSVNSGIKVLTKEADPDPSKGFNNPGLGKSIGQQMISQGADVLFQVAGGTGVGVLEAACAAGKYGIGVDVDQSLAVPSASKCIVTSAEKALKTYAEKVVLSVADGTFKAGTQLYNAASDPPGIGISPYHDFASLITPDIQAKVDAALAAMKAGTLNPPKS